MLNLYTSHWEYNIHVFNKLLQIKEKNENLNKRQDTVKQVDWFENV